MNRRQQLKDNKQILRTFMREHYTNDRLVQLLDHARAGKLAYHSCCCFIGIVTADHELQPTNDFLEGPGMWAHYNKAFHLGSAIEAEAAFLDLTANHGNDARRRRILIPMVKAEIRRRMKKESTPIEIPEFAPIAEGR